MLCLGIVAHQNVVFLRGKPLFWTTCSQTILPQAHLLHANAALLTRGSKETSSGATNVRRLERAGFVETVSEMSHLPTRLETKHLLGLRPPYLSSTVMHRAIVAFARIQGDRTV